MVELTSQQGAVLAFLSLATFTFMSVMCLWCRKKSKIVQEDNQLYVPQILQREGSRFAVTRSKTVTRPNQISPEQFHGPGNSVGVCNALPQVFQETQECTGYQNFVKPICGSLEPTYVDPIPTPPSKNVQEDVTDNDDDGPDYINIYQTESIAHDSDSYDYENVIGRADEKNQPQTDEDEPDYVNT